MAVSGHFGSRQCRRWQSLERPASVHLLPGRSSQVGVWIVEYACSVVDELAFAGPMTVRVRHESSSPGWIWVVHGMWGVWGASEAQTSVRSAVADLLQRRSECILCYIAQRSAFQPKWSITGLAINAGLEIMRKLRTFLHSGLASELIDSAPRLRLSYSQICLQ